VSDNIGKGFSLVMELEDPNRLTELMAKLGSELVKPRIQAALASLDYVHFARFLPLWDRGLLMIITEFDGAMQDYVMDFAAVLDDEFSLILSYMKGQPPLPVSRYPGKFWEYVDKNTGPKPPDPQAYPDVFSDYPGITALEIAGASREKVVPAQKRAAHDMVDLSDVQAHTIRSYKATLACYLGFRFEGAKPGRAMLAALAPRLANANASRNHEVCITLGLTHAGLQALGLPQQTLERFPVAFREGPRLRSDRLGDVGRSDPTKWEVAGTKDGQPTVVHGVVSIYTNQAIEGGKAAATVDRGLAIVGEAMASAAMSSLAMPYGPQAIALPAAKPKGAGPRAHVCFTCKAQAIGDQGEIHFGYRDGVGQPRFECVPSSGPKTATPPTPAGDLLLGPEYRNSRGGYYIGELPAALALNGTYAALRIIGQEVHKFEQLLDQVQQQYQVDPELTAAKMVGRWRDGAPVALYPTQANPTRPPKDPEKLKAYDPEAASTPAELLDAFDYNGKQYPHESQLLEQRGIEPQPLIEDDEGRRCPFGAHARRLNPRGGMVLGVPWGRRVVRRGMPYGPKFDKEKDKNEGNAGNKPPPRGLVGLFLCADLESQFEFLQHVWANQDLSAPGLRNTQDVFSSAQQIGTPFRFRPQENEAEISIMVPPLTTTVGSAYLFMPGINGLKWIAGAGWTADDQQAPAAPAPSPKTVRNTAMEEKPKLDATHHLFLNDPYEKYKEFRQAGVGWVDVPYETYWVFSHKLVAEVNQRKAEFLKPGRDRTGNKSGPFAVANNLKDGLFFMDPERHTQVRGVMDTIFKDAIGGAKGMAEELAKGLLAKALKKGQMDAISEFAGQLASQVFFRLMGVPQDAWELVDKWVRKALDGHRETMLPPLRAEGGTTTFALRTYFRALQESPNLASNSILAGMKAATACPYSNVKMDPDEAMNTALHMALGGYLSTEFLIGTGIYNLLRHPEQWQKLLQDRSLMDKAIDEMLRYDAPFQLADRWVNNENEKGEKIESIELGGEQLKSGTVIAVVYGSANRDETVFDKPDEFNITRSPAKEVDKLTPNLGFGDGVHRCIGERLARQVTAAAFGALLDLAPTARIGEVGPWAADPYFRSLTRLQLLLR